MPIIALASDHAGHPLREHLAGWLIETGNEVLDLGSRSADPVDYPDYAEILCKAVLEGRAGKGILVCGTGIGMSIAANRHRGIRAALCLYPRMAYYARHHNDANVLVLGGGLVGPKLACEITTTFLSEEFDGGRHGRRTGKLDSV